MVTITHKLVAIDTNVFIYYFGQHEKFGLPVKSIFDLLAKKKVNAVTSILTFTELLALSASEREIESLKTHFLETPNLVTFEVNQVIAYEAARIRRVYGFRLPDSIQLATAVHAKADFFITNDHRLKSFKEITVTLLNEGSSFR